MPGGDYFAPRAEDYIPQFEWALYKEEELIGRN